MKNRLLIAALFASAIATALPLGSQAVAQTAAPVDDEAVVAAVKSALAAKPELKADQLKITSKKGEVTISGPVENGTQLYQIGLVAQKVPGVKYVINDMEPKN